ncbi:armadillo-type protein, partial [Hyaloraphidium curvatum]
LASTLARIRAQRSSGLANQSRPAAVLLALEQSAADAGEALPLSAGAYFAGLAGVLERVAGDADAGETLAAVAYLLAAVFPHAPAPLVRAQSGALAARLTSLLPGAAPPLLRSLTACLAHLLLALPLSAWLADAAAKRVWRVLLLLAADPRPKVRKRAADGVRLVLSRPPTPVTNHPGSAAVLDFVAKGLEAAPGGSANEDARDAHTLHMLAFLASTLPLLLRGASAPAAVASLRGLLAKVLALPARSRDGTTAAHVYSVFAALFSTPDDEDHRLDPEMLGEILRALLEDVRPNDRDAQLAPLWMDVVSRGLDAEGPSPYVDTLAGLVSAFFAAAFDGFLAAANPAKPAVLNAATSALALVLSSALGPLADPPHPALQSIIASIAGSLGTVRFRRTTGNLLRLLGPLYASLASSPALPVLVANSLPTLIGFRDDVDYDSEFDSKEELEECLASAVRAAGMAAVLDAAPLNLRREEQGPGSPPRAYLLTTFRAALDSRPPSAIFGPDTLAFLQGTLMSLAAGESALSASSANPVAKKLHATLASQIWALCPGACAGNPRDVAERFAGLMSSSWGKILKRQAAFPTEEEADERLGTVCESLSQLVDGQRRVLAEGSEADRAKAAENLAAVGKQANKILAALCTLFTSLPAPRQGKRDERAEALRNRVRQAVGSFLRIAGGEDVRAYFVQLVASLVRSGLEEGGDKDERGNGCELLGILFPHLPELAREGDRPTLDAYLRFLAGEVKDPDGGAQKRGYRGLAAASGYLDAARLSAVLEGLVDAELSASVHPAARKARLVCLSALVRRVPETAEGGAMLLRFVPEVLPEAMLGTKEAGEKARAAGFECLVELGRRMVRAGGGEGEAGATEFFRMVAAGLDAESAGMQAAAAACLARLLFEFRGDMPDTLISDVVQSALFAAESRNRELAKAGLGFVKVAVVSLPQELLEEHLERVVGALLAHSREHQSHFKSKTKHIFERLIRRFSYEAVEGFVPEEDRKLLANIRKRKERAKRRRSGAEADDEEERGARVRGRTFEEVMADTDSEASGDEEEEKPGRKSQKGQKATYIREDADADVLDLLDPRLVSKVVTARPRKRTARNRDDDFEHAEDGRLVIEDESDEERDRKRAKGDVEMADADGEADYYTEAMTGEASFARTSEGRVKFSTGKKKGKAAETFDADPEKPGKGAWPEQRQNAFDARRAAKKSKLLDNPDVARMLGKQYKAKKASGDVKRAGMPDPHAYIPLTRTIVGNKRKGVKAAATFKKIVGAAQRGVKKASSKVKFARKAKR